MNEPPVVVELETQFDVMFESLYEIHLLTLQYSMEGNYCTYRILKGNSAVSSLPFGAGKIQLC